ncbi:MAG: prolyl oligopeptidase family serine peptidase [Acidobacteriota bacterium]
MKIFVIFAAIAISMSGCSNRSVPESEFPSRTVSVNGHEYKFRIFVPANHDTSKPIPVMLYLHGSGARGEDNQSQVDGLRDFVREHPERFPFVIVLPQCRPELFWAGEMMDQAIAALDQTVKEFNADPDRLYLAGYSMGGFGVWQTAVTYPNKFAALVPIAGGIKPQGPLPAEQKAMLSDAVRKAADSDDPYKGFADAIGNTPVWVFHGGTDDVVKPEGSRQMVATLKANGNPNVRYTEFENVGHDSIGNAFNEPGLFEWLQKQTLPHPSPNR